MVLERSTILQVSILRSLSPSNKSILLATTHLYFHPKAAHIRLVQIALIFRHIEHVLQEFQGERPSVILCGDFNSTLTTSLHEFIQTGHLPHTHADWYVGGNPEYSGFPLSHSLKLMNTCGKPLYTNYVAGFRACIDFIYAEKEAFEVVNVVPMPPHEDVVRLTALPNEVFPSDHLAVGCCLRWTL